MQIKIPQKLWNSDCWQNRNISHFDRVQRAEKSHEISPCVRFTHLVEMGFSVIFFKIINELLNWLCLRSEFPKYWGIFFKIFMKIMEAYILVKILGQVHRQVVKLLCLFLLIILHLHMKSFQKQFLLQLNKQMAS